MRMAHTEAMPYFDHLMYLQRGCHHRTPSARTGDRMPTWRFSVQTGNFNQSYRCTFTASLHLVYALDLSISKDRIRLLRTVAGCTDQTVSINPLYSGTEYHHRLASPCIRARLAGTQRPDSASQDGSGGYHPDRRYQPVILWQRVPSPPRFTLCTR